jgi:hypothetical protein
MAPRKLRFFKYQCLLYKKGSHDLHDLATSRFQICMRDAVLRCSVQFAHFPSVVQQFACERLRNHRQNAQIRFLRRSDPYQVKWALPAKTAALQH